MKTIISLQLQFGEHVITLWNGVEWECKTDPSLAEFCQILANQFIPSMQQWINPFEMMARGFASHNFKVLAVDKSKGTVDTL